MPNADHRRILLTAAIVLAAACGRTGLLPKGSPAASGGTVGGGNGGSRGSVSGSSDAAIDRGSRLEVGAEVGPDQRPDGTADARDAADRADSELQAVQGPARISYWQGKVNTRRDSGGTWTYDRDCSSGAEIDPLTYCQKFYPTTTSVTTVEVSTKPALLWNTASCNQQYSGNGLQEWTCNR